MRALGVLLFCLLPVSLAAQSASTVKIYSNPPGARFQVDGQWYTTEVAFNWTTGSKHTLTIDQTQRDQTQLVQYSFSSWKDSKNLMSVLDKTVTITADPSISYYRADVIKSYRMLVHDFGCNDVSCRGKVLGACQQL
ncbi:MAG: hypothetical protein FJW40_16755 [Acidobacteria bacterium]|nr:hypothetical protein [Acidobacteriota bacterium]